MSSMFWRGVVSAYLVDAGVHVERVPLPPGTGGRYTAAGKGYPAIIRESTALPPGVYRTKTLLHETAHYLAGHTWPKPHKDADVIATSVASNVLQYFGIDISEHRNNYLIAYRASPEDIARHREEILQITGTLVAIIEHGETSHDE